MRASQPNKLMPTDARGTLDIDILHEKTRLSRVFRVAGAGLKHKPATANPPEIRFFAHRIEESLLLA
jgi:hypothetical protein